MRPLLAALAVLVLGATLAIRPPTSVANEDPDPKQTKQIEKEAAKALKPEVKGFGKAARQQAGTTSKFIGTLDKSAKSGRNVESLSLVPSTPGVKVSLDQARGLAGAMFGALADFHRNALSDLGESYRAALADPAVMRYIDATGSSAVPGSGGPLDTARDSYEKAYGSANAKVKKAVAKLQSTLEGLGYTFTYVECVPPKLNTPGFGSPRDSVLSSHSFLVTIGDSDGGVYSIVAPADGGASDGRNGQVVLTSPSTGIGESLGNFNSDDPDKRVILFTRSDSTGDSYRPRLDQQSPNYLSLIYEQSDGTGNRRLIRRLEVPVGVPPLCDDPQEAALRTVYTLITGGSLLTTQLLDLTVGGIGRNSNASVPEKAIEDVIDQTQRAAQEVIDNASSSKIGRLDASIFPCGQGPNGFTVCPTIPAADPGGRLLVVAVAFGTDIPIADNVNSYQYGFVFDQDGNTSNNYVPSPQFAFDYFRGSDKWYAVEYTPSAGWELKVTDARNGSFVPVASAARAVISENSIVLAVPASEFSVANPAYRTTSFRHSGDFGQNAPFDYSADYDPPPDQPLRPFTE